MLMSNSTNKSHMRRTSSMRGIPIDDQQLLPRQNSTTMVLSNDHHHQNQILHSSETASSFLSSMNPHRRNSSSGGYWFDQSSNLLGTCGLCLRRLAAGRDLYMYKGNAAFCSLECREEQMKKDGPSADEH